MKQHMLIILMLVVLFLSPVNLFIFNANASNNWIIDGDTVYIDDENVYLSATPHTLINDGWVEFELETKSYDGNIDVVWGFDILDCTPHNPQIWRNYTHEFTGYHYVDRIGSIDIYNVTGWVNLGIENYNNYTVDYGNNNNTYLMNISYENNSFLNVAFTTYVEFGNGDDYRLTGHYDNYESYFYYEDFFDWDNWNINFQIINYEYENMNTWYLLKNISIVHNHRYKIRAWIDFKFNTNGKYWWALKPHDKTIQESITDGSFYSLDPWWNSDWNYYKTITIESDYLDNNLNNFPVLVNSTNATLIAKCNGGDSVRFLSLDNTTEFAYEMESWNSGGFNIWVNISETLTSDSDYQFLMYYGNGGASDNQDKEGVWDSNYLTVYHMSDNDNGLNDSTSNNNATEDVSDPPDSDDYEMLGKIHYSVEYDNTGTVGDSENHDIPDIMNNAGWNNGFTISYWCNFTTVDGYRTQLALQEDTSVILRLHINSRFVFWTHDGAVAQNLYSLTAVADTWYHVTATYDGTTKELIVNGTNKVTASENNIRPDVDGNDIGANNLDKLGMDSGEIDEIRISDITRNDTWNKVDFHSQNQTTGFLTWGDEQLKPLGSSPEISSEYPSNSSTGVTLFAVLGVAITDVDVDDMNLTWYSNVSGSWAVIGTSLLGVYNGTYYQKFDEFSIYGLTYYWNISVTDGVFTNDSDVFIFTAESTPTTPTGNGDIGLLGIFGFLGFILYKKLNKSKNNKKEK